MKILHITYLLGCILLLQGCEPIDVDRVDDEPIFTFDITVGGESYNLAAGLDSNFMFTEVRDPFFFHAPYNGVIGKRNASGLIDVSKPSLGVTFQVSESVRNSDSPDHFTSFKTGSIPIKTDDNSALPSKEVSFSAFYTGTGSEPTYFWDFGDGATVEFDEPIHAYPDIQLYTSNVMVTDENMCVASAQNAINFDGRDQCYATIEILNTSSTEAILEASSEGQGPFTYLWTDGSTSIDNVVTLDAGTSNQSHCVTITDSNGCISSTCTGFIRNNDGDINDCRVEMAVSHYRNIRTAPQFNSVDIEWKPGIQGIEFLSKEIMQPADSRFDILSVEEFSLNDFGQRTVKIEFEVSCTVWETNGTNPQKLEGKGTVAVAIPD